MYYTNLKSEYVDGVIEIITSNYKEAKTVMPILSDEYNKPLFQKNIIEKYVGSMDFVVAIDGDKVVGFIKGFPVSEFRGLSKGVVSPAFFHGVLDGYHKKKIYNELYGRASELWVSNGWYNHGMRIYINDKDTIEGWVMNGFGIVKVSALRDLNEIKTPVITNSLFVRKATKEDFDEIKNLYNAMSNHLSSAPVCLSQEDHNEYVKLDEQWFDNEDNILWLGEDGDTLAGFLMTTRRSSSGDEMEDGKTLRIQGGYVSSRYRGKYVMTKLINIALNNAKDAGMKRCTVDFESADMEGRNFWLKNFIPYAYLMTRKVDEREHIKLFGY